jgi:hypothetical protein
MSHTKRYLIALTIIFLLSGLSFCDDKYHWARVKFLGFRAQDKGGHDAWDISMGNDLEFLNFLEKNTTIKPEKKVNVATLDKLEEIVKYPVLFMTEEVEITFKDIEIKNMREYCLRGGVIWADDCVYQEKGDYFYKSIVKTIENKVFPGKKMEKLTMEHDIFHCHFDMAKGLPYNQGSPEGAWGLHDDKGRLMIIITPSDIHCGWDSVGNHFGDKNITDSYRMGTNIVIYALTH